MELKQAFTSHPDFSRLGADDLDVLAKAFTVDEHSTGHQFVGQGDRAGAAWLILEGEVAVTRLREPYIDELIRLGPGEMFGLASLVSGVRRTATCRAVSPGKSARIEKYALDVLMREHAPVGLALQRAVARQLAADYRNVAKLLHDMLEQRG